MAKPIYFVVSDTHGFYWIMRKALAERGFDLNNPNHIIIHCGDMLDRGTESNEMVDFFARLLDANRLIFIRGNHEDLWDGLVRHYFKPSVIDIVNGTAATAVFLSAPEAEFAYDTSNDAGIALLTGATKVGYINKNWQKLLKAAKDYYETPHFIFTHGWLPIGNRDWRQATKAEWENARWLNGMAEAEKRENRVPGKTVVCGHWCTNYGNIRKLEPGYHSDSFYAAKEWDTVAHTKEELTQIYFAEGIIALDASTVWSGRVNVLVLTDL